tara:strand:+ start:5549 stop:7618 length:2070 start_codon:yes stop_codon:yes gene_type:complete
MKRSGKTVAIIQARMGASRFPGKVLEPIGPEPMLWHVTKRVGESERVDQVVVATTISSIDDPIDVWCKESGILCVRGSETDVLDRYYVAAKEAKAERVVRITADCPFSDPDILDCVLAEFDSGEAEYVTNTMPYSWPDGFDVEVFDFEGLERAWKEATSASDREHVTPYMRREFRCHNVIGPKDPEIRKWRLTVDHADDLEYVRAIYVELGSRWDVGFEEIESLIRSRPEALPRPPSEAHVANEGFYKSIFDEAVKISAPLLPVEKSEEWFARAKKVIPGCAQTFSKSHLQHIRGVSPLFLTKGKGSRVWDADGNEYVDYIQGLLPNILGYGNEEVNAAFSKQLSEGHSFSLPHPVEVELSERLCSLIPCAEMVRFGKNGSDATSGAVRMARAFTGRDRIACCGYHGWQDWFIGSTSLNAGVPTAVQELTHPFPYNDISALRSLLDKHPGEFAAVIMEPFNFVEPHPGYLAEVKALAHKEGVLLIFDEICSGFHFGLGGAQKMFGVIPDLACFGKAMANGFPLSAVVGRSDVMKICEDVFFSFTFGGEVASMAATSKVLEILENTDCLQRMDGLGRTLLDGVNTLAKEAGLENRIRAVGRPSWSMIQFTDDEGENCMLSRSLFQQEVVKRGILILTTHNMCAAHTQRDVEKALEAYASTFKLLADWLTDANPMQYLQGEPIEQLFRVRA